jgi:acyl-CoA reductase-like NAD-dependent aldehyde dehydrogenase
VTALTTPGAFTQPTLTIAGQPIDGEPDEVRDPATQSVIGYAPVASTAALAEAVESAAEASGSWAALPAHARGAHLAAIAVWIRQHARELATTLTL